MDDLLFLTHRLPYPPNKGDKIRSWQLLQFLSRRYRVHLATFVDEKDDWRYVPHVQAQCASAHISHLDPRMARVRSLLALARNEPLSLRYYRDGAMQEWVHRTVAQRGIARMVAFSSPMAQYLSTYTAAQRVVDFCDVDSDKWRQYAEKKPWPASALYRYEASRLLRWERKAALNCDAALFVSRAEVELFSRLAPEASGRCYTVCNGVDTAYFSPKRSYDNPYPPGMLPIVFCGAMDYWPNVDAVSWFARQILPGALANHPNLGLWIVGARPTAQVKALAALPGVVVTGAVPDVRPYVSHAVLSVAPLRVARGIQNKVLEAMAMAKPVLLTPQALEGIDAESGLEVLLARSAEEFSGVLHAALDLPPASLAAIGRAARRRAETNYGWQARLSNLQELLEDPWKASRMGGGA
ncbi:TIGR03087 family PEP-CTERM/XrtA system glycosyltransferase [Massilia endophytica]|uniref:TIGR03087 family PEP-CTERM/XrtA system glycosyltransferase n=1 Tax=Massilia endophytica TaxID=2899220 RepID=UPI001E382DC5|nr:TIGR03087 family PEP-CTERM/XrtA system glycosyltransferase [Massilia endophytica]UGQ46214.1 TIGR03087 family PEP-CTERM/XrtA system glycosyltransferase [Massilia endophytica]